MNIVFMGTPDFAVPTLEKLAESYHKILAVYTQPDKPVGRKQLLTPPDVKVCAEKYNIPVFQPTTLRDEISYKELKKLNPDVIVVVAYGKILPKDILDIPKYGCVNVHASLLPKYRGASPIQHSVLNGDKITGVTTMFMGEEMDTGDILLTSETEIGENETSAELFDRLSLLGADLLLETLEGLENSSITPLKQDDSKATYTVKITKSMCPIDWTKTNFEIHNQVRGLQTWPVATSTLNGKDIKVHSTFLCKKSGNAGEVIDLNPLTVACGEGSLVIKELQLNGKKRMDSKTFLLGHPLNIGDKFI
ncbi:MAG: methionyl-tRNA formyltransferase [Ruminococcus sp.]|nr:methionyl-tRNA formyltransferase [Ruminococcus sp.]